MPRLGSSNQPNLPINKEASTKFNRALIRPLLMLWTAPNVRILYTSGYPIEPRRDVADSEFFSKPYQVEDILEACKR